MSVVWWFPCNLISAPQQRHIQARLSMTCQVREFTNNDKLVLMFQTTAGTPYDNRFHPHLKNAIREKYKNKQTHKRHEILFLTQRLFGCRQANMLCLVPGNALATDEKSVLAQILGLLVPCYLRFFSTAGEQQPKRDGQRVWLTVTVACARRALLRSSVLRHILP